MVCILSSTYSQPLHEIRFYTRAKQTPLRQHCINCIGLILHRTVTIVSNLNGKTGREQKIFPHNLFSLWFCRRSCVSHQHRNAPKIFHCFEMEFWWPSSPHQIPLFCVPRYQTCPRNGFTTKAIFHFSWTSFLRHQKSDRCLHLVRPEQR